MIILGLTGSIGMGKTTVAVQLAAMGAKVCSADAIVHRLLAKGGAAVGPVGKLFPDVMKAGAIDRKALGEIVFKNKKKLKQLEDILHPLVVEEENRFLERQQRLGARIAVLEIPLLFETGAEKRCDMVVVTTAPPYLQRQRVMQRPGMTEEKFQRILAAQMPDAEKRRRGDWIIQTGLGKAYSQRQVALLLRLLCSVRLCSIPKPPDSILIRGIASSKSVASRS